MYDEFDTRPRQHASATRKAQHATAARNGSTQGQHARAARTLELKLERSGDWLARPLLHGRRREVGRLDGLGERRRQVRLHRQQQVEALGAHFLRLEKVGLVPAPEPMRLHAILTVGARVGLQQRLLTAAAAAEDLAALPAVVPPRHHVELGAAAHAIWSSVIRQPSRAS